jgi:hypothetical protein
MSRRIVGLFGLLAACAAIFISASGAGADTVAPDSTTQVAAVQADNHGGSYDYSQSDDDGGDYYATTTEAPTTTVPKTTTTEAPTTTAAPTTTVAPTTTQAPKVLAKHVDPVRPRVAAASDELAYTGVGSVTLAAIGCGALALGLLARRTARTRR